jgi:arginase
MTNPTDRFILTPFFLDEPLPGLDDLAGAHWIVNRPSLRSDTVQARILAINESLAVAVSTAVRGGERPVSVAGDCCATLGMVAGLQRSGLDPALVWFDAHGDFNTWETSPSGFLGGMPLAMLAGRGELTMAQGLGLRPLREERIVLSDGRDLDPLEADALAGSGVQLRPLVELSLPPGPLYIHFDVDILRTADMPAVNYPAAEGPTVDELAHVFSILAKTGRVAAASMSAWNPELDEDGRCRKTAMSLLQLLLA